jgi:hypothetical protein
MREVHMDLISGEKLEKMTSMEKIRLILDKVKKRQDRGFGERTYF